MELIARLAAPSAFLAIPAVILAAVTLAIFFLGPGEPFGTFNDVFDAIALLLLIPPVIGIHARIADQAAGWLGPLTALTVIGLLVAAVGQLLLVARVIDLGTSYVTGGIGILPVLVWLAALIWLSFGAQLLPGLLGWAGAALVATIVLVGVLASLRMEASTGIAAVVLLLVLCGWLAALGSALRNDTAAILGASDQSALSWVSSGALKLGVNGRTDGRARQRSRVDQAALESV